MTTYDHNRPTLLVAYDSRANLWLGNLLAPSSMASVWLLTAAVGAVGTAWTRDIWLAYRGDKVMDLVERIGALVTLLGIAVIVWVAVAMGWPCI